jgi:hypothetical protein
MSGYCCRLPEPTPGVVAVSRAKSITDLANQEGLTETYVCRLLPLTCLAPDIVEAILDGRQPKGLRLAGVLGNEPLAWEEQKSVWGLAQRPCVVRLATRYGDAPSCDDLLNDPHHLPPVRAVTLGMVL